MTWMNAITKERKRMSKTENIQRRVMLDKIIWLVMMTRVFRPLLFVNHMYNILFLLLLWLDCWLKVSIINFINQLLVDINDINDIDTNNEHVKQQHNCCNLYYYIYHISPLTLILSCNLQTRHNTSEVYNELICWLVCYQYQILMRWCYLMHNIWYYEVLQKSMINESTQLTRYGKVNLEQIFFV